MGHRCVEYTIPSEPLEGHILDQTVRKETGHRIDSLGTKRQLKLKR